MNEELKNLYDNKIMIFKKQLPKGTYPTSTKWIYTIKRDGNGNIKKYKAWIVARGFS